MTTARKVELVEATRAMFGLQPALEALGLARSTWPTSDAIGDRSRNATGISGDVWRGLPGRTQSTVIAG
jgi:hypothetical protein